LEKNIESVEKLSESLMTIKDRKEEYNQAYEIMLDHLKKYQEKFGGDIGQSLNARLADISEFHKHEDSLDKIRETLHGSTNKGDSHITDNQQGKRDGRSR